jgi:hypothetical protein
MRTSKPTCAALMILLFAFSAAGQAKLDLASATTVDFCDLVHRAAVYDQKLIRVRALYIAGFEGSQFRKLDCDDKDVWVEFDPSLERNSKRKVFKTFSRLTDTSPVVTPGGGLDHPTRTVEVVAVGRFDGARQSYKVGNMTRTQGYGHLNGFDFRFTVLLIEEVKALPK